jgi:hypothetical protein
MIYDTKSIRATCISCAYGYFLSNNTCLKLRDPNCSRGTSLTNCIECKGGYIFNYFSVPPSCVVPPLIITLNCSASDFLIPNKIDVTKLSCNTCYENYIPSNY